MVIVLLMIVAPAAFHCVLPKLKVQSVWLCRVAVEFLSIAENYQLIINKYDLFRQPDVRGTVTAGITHLMR